MSACACPIILGDCIGVDSPITGLSSLADDHCYFYASCSPRGDAFAPPPLGGGFVTQQCAYTVLAAETQAEADALAAAACNGLPQPPPEPIPPPTPGESLFICNATPYANVVSPNIVGLAQPLSFSGNLFPPDINVSSDVDPTKAVVSGLTTMPGDYPDATITAFDVTGQFKQTQYPTTVLGITNALTLPDPSSHTGYSVQLPDGACLTPYNVSLTTLGGTDPITFVVNDPLAPAWVHVSDSGIVTGTPQESDVGNDFYFDVTITDAKGNVCVQTVHIPVKCTVDPPPGGHLCTAYSSQLIYCPVSHQANAWAGSSAPPGMTVSGDGLLSGTPTSLGANVFSVVILQDNGDYCNAQVTLNVGPGPSLTVVSNGVFRNDTAVTITLNILSGGYPIVDMPATITPGQTFDYYADCVNNWGIIPFGHFVFDIGCNAVASAYWPVPLYDGISLSTYGGGDFNSLVPYTPSTPVASGDTICFVIAGRFFEGEPVWYRITAHLGGPGGPYFDTGLIPGPPGSDPPGFVNACWTAP